MKIHRMLEITTLLLNRGTLTARELAERFEVSVRTIYRDVEALSAAGVPVYMTRGNGGGISLMESYTLNKALFSQQESENLLLALGSLKAARVFDLDAVLDKIGSVFQHDQSADWLQIDPIGWGGPPRESEKFTLLKNALVSHRAVTFSYINAENTTTRRTVEPRKLIFNTYNWYLLAYCRLRKETRFFRISRMRDLVLCDETFVPHELPKEGFSAEGFSGQGTPSRNESIVLRFDGKELSRLYDYFDESMLQKNGDRYDVRVFMPVDEGLYSFLFSFGDTLEVVEPLAVREEFARRVRRILAHYEPTS